MSKHRRVRCQKCWEWGEEREHLKQKVCLCTWTIQKPVGVWLEYYQSIRDKDIILIGWWIMPCRRGGLAWPGFGFWSEADSKGQSQEHVQGSRFFKQPHQGWGLSVPVQVVYGKHCESWGCSGSLVCVRGSAIHHSGFHGSCFCGRQTVPSLIHCSRNHNKHPESLESSHTRFFLHILFLFLWKKCAWGVSNALSVLLMLSSALE